MTDTSEAAVADNAEAAAAAAPSDREVVALLQRLASARAHLLKAEQVADQERAEARRAAARNDEVEEAHTDLLWAQAELITAQKEPRARRAVDQARQREQQALRRFGFSSFHDYLDRRTSIPDADVQLDFARREHAAASAEWEALTRTGSTEGSGSPTIVLDLTGVNPRRIA